MIRTCLFLSFFALALVDVAADQGHTESERPSHHHRPHRPHQDGLSQVRPSHRTIHRMRTTTKAFETDGFRRQNHQRIREEDQSIAFVIAGTVGLALILILAIVVVALVLRNKRRRKEKIIEKQSKRVANPRHRVSIINPKLHGPPPPYDNVKIKNVNSVIPVYGADQYDIKMDDVKGIKFNHPVGLNKKSSKQPKFEDLYNHLNATDVQNVHQNLYKRGDSTDDSNGGDDADNELSDEVEVQVPSKENKDNSCPDDNKANTIPSKF